MQALGACPNSPPRQIFRGWVTWFARGPNNDIYVIQGQADLNGCPLEGRLERPRARSSSGHHPLVL